MQGFVRRVFKFLYFQEALDPHCHRLSIAVDTMESYEITTVPAGYSTPEAMVSQLQPE
jgi:hypothetical protein